MRGGLGVGDNFGKVVFIDTCLKPCCWVLPTQKL